MTYRATRPAAPAARAEAKPQATSAPHDQPPAADAVAAGAVGTLGGGLPEPRRFGRVQGYQAVLAMQRTHGNAAVLRMLARAADAGGRGPAVQRHTSVELEEPENAVKRRVVQRLAIQRDLASDLSQAMSIGVAGMPMLLQAIPRASADDRRAVLNNSPLLAELKAWLPRGTMVSVLNQLGAPLADQLDTAIEGSGAAVDALMVAIESPTTPAAQKRVVLRNPELMARLRGKLHQASAVRAMRGLGASLTEILYAAMEDVLHGLVPPDQEEIVKPIATAPAAEKLAALRDRALIGRLTSELSLGNLLRALEALGASPADRLNTIMDRADTDTRAVDAIAKGATEAQRREILENAALVARLRSKLSRLEMQSALSHLGASLADQLALALDGGDADLPATVVLIEAADQADRELVREHTALVGRLQAAMSAPTFERVRLLIGLPAPLTAGEPSTPMTLGGNVPGAAGGAEVTADPDEPTTLVGKVSVALDQTPPDVAAAIAAISAGTPDELATVRGDTTLRERLYATLDQAQLLHVMPMLGMGLGSRLTALLDRKVGVADIHAHLVVATPDEKRSVLDDRALVERLVGYAGEPERTLVLGALGDTLGNQVDQLLAGTPTLTALGNLIRGASQAARDEVFGNSALMGRIAGAFDAYDVFKTQFLLLYGNEAAYPGPVAMVVNACVMPRLWVVKPALAQLADADLAKVRTAVREYLRPRLGEAEFATLLRILDQGLITEETIKESDPGRKMLADHPYFGPFIFAEREFTGTRGFDVAYYRDRVQVSVRIKFEARGGDAAAEAALPGLLPGWEAVIEGAWDNKFSLRNAARNLPIRIDMVANSGSPHHTVKVGSATNVQWGMFNTFNWYFQATTFNLANAIPHEFGHMLGNPDEYNLSAAVYQARVGQPGATDPNATSQTDTIGQQRFTNVTSAMGSPALGAGTVERRHLNYFANWINRNLVPGEPAFMVV